jgi:gamma-glutamyltranspeptidase
MTDAVPGSGHPMRSPASHGMVAAPHRLASRAAATVLRAGGNAVDAAVAAAATIAVVYPHMNGIGGDSFWLIHDVSAGRLMGLGSAGRSAAAVDPGWYRARFGDAIAPRGGPAALTVPGTVAGWWSAHLYSRDRLGSTVGWPALLEEAITHARDGFEVSDGQLRVSAQASALFTEGVSEEIRRGFWPIFHPDRLKAGPFTQPDLARTLQTVAAEGADEFYRGDLGRRIAAAAAAAGSPLRAPAFAEHRAEWVEPLRVRYRGGEAASFPPPTQGFAALAILGLLDGFDVAGLEEADYVHAVVEATKLAFQDRDRYLADPDVVPVPVAECLDASRLARRRARIVNDRAMPLEGPPVEGDTIAIVTADRHGNAVSVIQSLYHEFGAAVVAGDTGVLLQNRGTFFSLDPSHPNCLAPRKRPAHTLIPSMYLVDAKPRFVYGTMGGDGQPQTQAALVTRLVDRGLDPRAAVEAPRWLLGRTWGETTRALRLEARFPAGVVASLRARGHDAQVVDPWSDLMGHAQVIEIGADGFRGGSDPRADGAALEG